jgi:hypothetical protein
MSEHFVRHDQEQMILRHVECDELARSIENSKCEGRTTALGAHLDRQPSIFCTRNYVLSREKPLCAGRRRHV